MPRIKIRKHKLYDRSDFLRFDANIQLYFYTETFLEKFKLAYGNPTVKT